MQQDFNYADVPLLFDHCTYSPCVHANNCMRQKIIAYVPQERARLTIINPARIPANGENCPYFFSEQKSLFALGITHLLDNVPHNKALSIKNEMLNHFKRNTYYRIRNKERLITPAEQQFIRQLFINKGMDTEPVFDKYVEGYDW